METLKYLAEQYRQARRTWRWCKARLLLEYACWRSKRAEKRLGVDIAVLGDKALEEPVSPGVRETLIWYFRINECLTCLERDGDWEVVW